jgi:outer membrane receptor for ferrienterochelin and colicins
MNKLIIPACLSLLGAVAMPSHAQESKEAVTKAPPQVTVNAARANETETRRNATASKMIFGREELDRNGDSNIGEILKRLPGVTMGGPPGRGGGGVRMRGLGNGYTQMLVNGERAPAGFSLESLSPDQVERIEVMRGPVAEHSTQAIAGTINIVLREGYQQKDLQLKLADSVEHGMHSPSLSVALPGKRGNMTWLMNAQLMVTRQGDQGEVLYQNVKDDGTLVKDQSVASHGARRTTGLHLMPRLSWKFDNGDTLNFQPMIIANRSDGNSDSALTQRVVPPAPEYALALGSAESSAAFMRAFGNWLHRMDAGAKLDIKFGFGGGRSKNASLRHQYDAGGALRDTFIDSDRSSNTGLSTGGKYTKSLAKGHLLAAGWDLETGHRSQTISTLKNGSPQYPQSGDNLAADTRRVAAFVQDEWDITPQWGVYLGLRWEGIRTSATTPASATTAQRDTRSSSGVWSPVLHTVWRIPGHDKDQVRASLTQSYRAPQLNDLIAAPVIVQLNDPTRPDRSGNPDLKPELAKGIDLAYEHYIGKSGILSASAFVRNIDNLMRRKLTTYVGPDGDTRYLSRPSNVGSARTSGIELEAKLQLADVMADAPNVDLRANYSHFWSSVDGIPGPDNRLDGQARQSANLGLDYRLKKLPLTVGGSYNWTPASLVQTSLTERASTGVKRQFDAYGLWKWSAATQLRLGVNNLLGDDYLSDRAVRTADMLASSRASSRTYTTWSARLEMKL